MDNSAGPIVLEGSILVERAAGLGLTIERLLCVPAREAWARALLRYGEGIEVLPEAEIARREGFPFHRGVIAYARRPLERRAAELMEGLDQEAATILVLPETKDPENLGAIFRSASALGCSAILLGPGGPDPYCRRVLRVSMGASLILPWARLPGPEALDDLAGRGWTAAAAVLDGRDVRGYERPARLALVMGDESEGLGPEWRKRCAVELSVPMAPGPDSLNVAAAAAILLWETGARAARWITCRPCRCPG